MRTANLRAREADTLTSINQANNVTAGDAHETADRVVHILYPSAPLSRPLLGLLSGLRLVSQSHTALLVSSELCVVAASQRLSNCVCVRSPPNVKVVPMSFDI